MTKQILVGGVPIGGGAPVVIQSMLNTKTTDVEGSLKQIRQLASAGCQIARLAVPNMEAARSFADICKDSPLPLVADIHFDYRLAIAAAEGGASKIRINPGNIGGGAPVVIQSMLNTKTTDVEGSLKQIRQLASAGCQIARLAVPNMEAARSFADICKDSPLPLVADIHFDYKLAIAAAEGGASKIRINPGNIGGEDRVKAVVEVCKDKHIPIRIGVNGGSLDKRLLEKYGHPTAEALVESAFEHLELLEKQGFYDTCVSMKSSTVPTMVAAARLFRAKCDYPLHIGVTETGPVRQGLIKSAMGIGALLLDGIGDTIRVSLTDDPVQEVYAARDILKAAGLRKDGVNIVSCPTCGRTRIDLIGLVNRVDEALKNCEKPITVAVMGCVVNGPGEAREADIGIAGGDGWGMIFEKGVQVEKLPYDELLPALLKRIEAL